MPGARDVSADSSSKRHGHPDAVVARIASRQHGVIALVQLLAAGLTRGDVAYRVKVGRLHPVFRGVYAVGHRAISQRGLLMAAVLALGDGAVLSHRAAAVLWQVWRWEGGSVDVTAPTQRRRRDGIRVHRGSLDAADVSRRYGVPVTTPARTILDLAPSLTRDALAHLVGQAEQARLVSVPSLRREIERRGRQSGTARVRAVIDRGPAPTRSIMEVRFLSLLDQYHLPRPQMNAKLLGYEVDGLYEEHGLVVELDSHRWHDSPLAQAADRERTAALEAAGWRVLRLSSEDLTEHRERTAQRLRAALASPKGSPQPE